MQEACDSVYVGGHVLTMDARHPVVEAIGVQDGRIVATGSNDELRESIGRSTNVIDLAGRTVVPGFIDGHVHPDVMIKTLGHLDCRFATTPSLAALLDKLRRHAESLPEGQWVIAAGQASNSTNFPEKRLPTRWELDAAAPRWPLFYMNGPHTCVTNSMGLERLGISNGMSELKGTHIDLDESGEPTGVLHEPFAIAPERRITEEAIRRYLTEDIPTFFLQRGVTSLMFLSATPNFKVFRDVAGSGVRLPIRYSFGAFADPGGKALPSTFDALRMPESADPEWFRLAGIKIWLDGDVPVRTGYLFDPYHQCDTHGIASNSQEELDTLVQRVHDAGLGMLIHCTGDRANVMALDAYEKVIRRGDPRTLMRIEHLGDFLLGPGVLERSRALDVKANVQPGWIYTLANVMINNLGEERAKAQSFQFRTMIDAGLEPGYGSDLTGFVRETENPFMHIQAAVTRGAADGTTFVPEQAVTVDEALHMMTIWSTRAQGEGHLKGSIERGKLADFAVLSDDITRVAPTAIRDLSVVKTVVGGEVVYEA